MRLNAAVYDVRALGSPPAAGGGAMTVPEVDKALPWDGVTRTVAQSVAAHLPDATVTEAYYHLVVRHIAQLLWRLDAADKALQALGGVLRASAQDGRERVNDASATTRLQPWLEQ